MSRVSAVALVAFAALAVTAVTGCSKADSKPVGSSPPRAVESGGKGTIGAAAPAAAEGAMPADQVESSGPDDSFAVEYAEVSGAAGGESVARIVVTPGKGFHMNKEYPTKLTLQLPAGVTSPKAVLLPADAEAFTENKLAFAVKLTAADKGDFKIPAVLKFAVCTDSTCNPKKQQLALSLKAQ